MGKTQVVAVISEGAALPKRRDVRLRRSLKDVNSENNNGLPKAVRRRRDSGISAYVGKNGSGKSLLAVRDILPDLENGVPVLSNIGLLARKNASNIEEADEVWEKLGVPNLRPHDLLRLPHKNWIPWTNFQQLVDFRNGIVLCDEAHGIADARDSAGLPAEVRNMLFQLRRNGVSFRYTTIDYSAVDKRLRNATTLLTFCAGKFGKRVEGSVWPRNRVFHYRSYDAQDFLDFTEANSRVHEQNRPPIAFRQWARISGDLKGASETYSSGAAVLSLGSSGEGGKCIACGKKRRVQACSCPDH